MVHTLARVAIAAVALNAAVSLASHDYDLDTRDLDQDVSTFERRHYTRRELEDMVAGLQRRQKLPEGTADRTADPARCRRGFSEDMVAGLQRRQRHPEGTAAPCRRGFSEFERRAEDVVPAHAATEESSDSSVSSIPTSTKRKGQLRRREFIDYEDLEARDYEELDARDYLDVERRDGVDTPATPVPDVSTGADGTASATAAFTTKKGKKKTANGASPSLSRRGDRYQDLDARDYLDVERRDGVDTPATPVPDVSTGADGTASATAAFTTKKGKKKTANGALSRRGDRYQDLDARDYLDVERRDGVDTPATPVPDVSTGADGTASATAASATKKGTKKTANRASPSLSRRGDQYEDLVARASLDVERRENSDADPSDGTPLPAPQVKKKAKKPQLAPARRSLYRRDAPNPDAPIPESGSDLTSSATSATSATSSGRKLRKKFKHSGSLSGSASAGATVSSGATVSRRDLGDFALDELD